MFPHAFCELLSKRYMIMPTCCVLLSHRQTTITAWVLTKRLLLSYRYTLGKYLTDVLDEVEASVKEKFSEQDEVILKLDIHKQIPELLMDNT